MQMKNFEYLPHNNVTFDSNQGGIKIFENYEWNAEYAVEPLVIPSGWEKRKLSKTLKTPPPAKLS